MLEQHEVEGEKMEPYNASLMAALGALVERYAAGRGIRPADRRELDYLALGRSIKDSAAAQGVSLETVKARRKRLYAKLGVEGAPQLLSRLVVLALLGVDSGSAP